MDWSRWRQEFPVSTERIHFNHAGVSPVSRRVVEATTRFIQDAAEFDPVKLRQWEWHAEEVRDSFARLVGASGEEIAFVKNTSEGLSLVAAGIDWREGDNVIAIDGEYPSNVYPWWGLRRKGVETRMATPRSAVITVDDLRPLADRCTRVVAISFVDWSSGARHELASIGSWCREQGILFCVDGIQGVGAVPLDVEACAIDCLAVGGHKWLLAPEGVGCLYVSRRIVDRLHTVLLGWKSVSNAETYLPYHFDVRPDAAKFEPGSPPTLGTAAFGAAVDLLHEIGPTTVTARLMEINDRLAEGLRRLGAEIVSPWNPEQRSGIVVFRLGETPSLYDRLTKDGFVVRLRGGGIRVAPHFYNSDDQIDRLIDVVAGARGDRK